MSIRILSASKLFPSSSDGDGRTTNSFEGDPLPHKCGVPASFGTPHLCGSEESCAPEGDRAEAEAGFRGLDERLRFIALPVRQRSRGEGQSKSPCPCLPRSGLLSDLPSLRPFLSCPASRSPRASVGDRSRIHCRAGPGEFPCCRTRAAP